MRLEHLPKILTARLNGRGPMAWDESMGTDRLVSDVEASFGLDGLNAAYQLFAYLVDEENQSRTGLDEARLSAAEQIPYIQAALRSVETGLWMGRFDSPGVWAKSVYVLPMPVDTAGSGFCWDEYVDWERLGEDLLFGHSPTYAVVHQVGDEHRTGPIWVFQRRGVRTLLRVEVRRCTGNSDNTTAEESNDGVEPA